MRKRCSIAEDTASIVVIAGGIAIGGKTGVGLSITEVTVIDTTEAWIDAAATVSGDGISNFTDVLGNVRSGVSVEANSDETIVNIAVGGAFSTQAAGAGAATVTYIDVAARAYQKAASAVPGAGAGITSLHDVDIVARGHLSLTGVAGAIAGSKVGIGIGADAGVVTRRVEAYIAGGKVHAGNNVVVMAQSDVSIVSVSGSVAIGTTGAGASVLAGMSASWRPVGSDTYNASISIGSSQPANGMVPPSSTSSGTGRR